MLSISINKALNLMYCYTYRFITPFIFCFHFLMKLFLAERTYDQYSGVLIVNISFNYYLKEYAWLQQSVLRWYQPTNLSLCCISAAKWRLEINWREIEKFRANDITLKRVFLTARTSSFDSAYRVSMAPKNGYQLLNAKDIHCILFDWFLRRVFLVIIEIFPFWLRPTKAGQHMLKRCLSWVSHVMQRVLNNDMVRLCQHTDSPLSKVACHLEEICSEISHN